MINFFTLIEGWYYKDDHPKFRPITDMQLYKILDAYLEYYVPRDTPTKEKPPYPLKKRFY